MDQMTTLHYWGMVASRAANKAWEKFGALGTLLGIAVPILAVYITSRPKSWADFWESDAVITAALIVALFAAVLIIYIIREPVIVHNTQQTDIANLREKYEYEPIKINFILDIWEFLEPETTFVQGAHTNAVTTINKVAGIKVVNPADENLLCRGLLVSLIRINADGTQNDLTLEATRNGPAFSWSGGGANEAGEVVISTNRILNVAYGIGREMIFKLQKLDFPQSNNGKYLLGIIFGGHIGGKRIEDNLELFWIEFEKMDKTFAGGSERRYSSTDITLLLTWKITKNTVPVLTES